MTLATAPISGAATASALRVRDAAKSFGDVQALRGATFELRAGERLALLGPNGAGKTTLIRAIAGRVRLDRGAVEMFGQALNPEQRLAHLGVVPQEIALYPLLTARENLETFGRLQGVTARDLETRVEWALGWTALGDRAKEPVKGFSSGMKRRLNIACGVLHAPKIVLLDEPTVGVDPQSRERIYDMLAELCAGGTTLLLTTHQLDEAESRCDRIVILDHGQVVAAGTLAELVTRTVGGGRVVALTLDRPAEGLAGFEAEPGGRRVRASVEDVGTDVPRLIARVQAAGYRVEDLEVQRHDLHEVFLKLTGKDLRE